MPVDDATDPSTVGPRGQEDGDLATPVPERHEHQVGEAHQGKGPQDPGHQVGRRAHAPEVGDDPRDLGPPEREADGVAQSGADRFGIGAGPQGDRGRRERGPVIERAEGVGGDQAALAQSVAPLDAGDDHDSHHIEAVLPRRSLRP